ncbi:hypothetical protein [Streptomyces sp. SID3343]|uniref:hypothetical protein n=1 Tax=Streptomyces sp. SID3343 TaxID=2690260 RepID=UPI0031F8C015
MLKRMRWIRWDELTHAYGSAADVPGQLSRIAWGDTETAGAALSELSGHIAEFGGFDSTVAAVPFLWELATTHVSPCRAGVVGLLRTVVVHGSCQDESYRAVLAGAAAIEALTVDQDAVVAAAARSLGAVLAGHSCGWCGVGARFAGGS